MVTVALEAQKSMLGQDLTEEEEILVVSAIFYKKTKRNNFSGFFTIFV